MSVLVVLCSRSHATLAQENRYKDMIRRLKRLLETERKNLRQVRSQYAAELQNRTELEIFLHQCIEDVKHDIARRRSQLMSGSTSRRVGCGSSMKCDSPWCCFVSPGKATFPPVAGAAAKGEGDDTPLSAFTAADRERVMELLLSQERVISLLYSKTFPPRSSSAAGEDGLGLGGTQGSGGGVGDSGSLEASTALLGKPGSFASSDGRAMLDQHGDGE